MNRRTPLLAIAGFFVVSCGLAAASSSGPEPQRKPYDPRMLKLTTPVKGPIDRFLHEHHSGQVAVPGKPGQTRELKCETCHAVSEGMPDTNKFPGPDLIKHPETAKFANTGTRLNRMGFTKAHSACIECHGGAIKPGPGGQMCAMCHVSSAQLLPFPSANIEQSQFADRYSHKAHKDYLDSFPNPSGVKTDAKPEKGLRCSECHDPAQGGVKMTLPVHQECFVCHANVKIVSKSADSFWTACTGCHANMAENKPTVNPKLKVPKDAEYGVAAEIMPLRYVVTPTGRGNAPFNHVGGKAKYHEVLKPDTGRMAGKTVEGKAACIFCHTSAERAASRTQMQAFALRRTDPPVPQPPGTACSACHVHAEQMWFDKTPVTKVMRNKCLECHTAEDAAKDPPESHKPPAAAEAKPAETPAEKPAEKPAEAPPAKPEGTARLVSWSAWTWGR